MLAVQRGAAIVRVHDVRETVGALKVLAATISGAMPLQADAQETTR